MSSGEAAVEMLPEVLDYLGEQHTLTLATASPSGVPHAGTFLYVHDGPELYFWTKAHTTTARHIEQNPLVSFTIDGYADDLQKIRGLQGRGECRVILSGEQIARVADLFGQKFPALSPGTTMTISFFRIVASELQFTDNTDASIHQQEGTFGVEFHRERAYSVFADLPLQSVSSLTGELQLLDFPAGEVIARAGGPADKFFIVVDGAVEVNREGVGGEGVGEDTPVSLGPGQFFGELAILRDRPRTATLKALEPTRLLALDRDTFRDIVAESLGTTKDFDAIVRERLRSLD
jgi:uncharacterized protein YhbP (UPF0306 family)